MRVALHMTAALMLGSALSEINLEMSMKTFAQYHWLLSAVIVLWQVGDTATPLGKAMFALPHLFTVWSTSLYLGGDSKKSD